MVYILSNEEKRRENEQKGTAKKMKRIGKSLKRKSTRLRILLRDGTRLKK
jgi:hypothetical protein